MRHPGTDMLALACIVGGGVVAGGVTLALAGDSVLPSLECATTVGSDADVVVALGGEGLVVVTPDVRVREVKQCMQDVDAHQVRVELTQAIEGEQRVIERAEREVERARREAERVRREVDRVRDRVRRVDGRRMDRDQERRQERMERTREQLERARERTELRTEVHLRGGRHIDSERISMLTREALERARVEMIDLQELDFDGELLDGFQIELPNRTFEFSFQGLGEREFEGLEEALSLQLEVLEGLDFEFEGLDAELEEEIEQRLDERMSQLEERLKRVRENGGR